MVVVTVVKVTGLVVVVNDVKNRFGVNFQSGENNGLGGCGQGGENDGF